NINGSQLDVYMSEAGSEIFHETIYLVNDDAVVDYYEYFFEPIIRLTDVVVNLPVDVINPTISIKLTGDSDVAIGQMTVGQSYFIGRVRYGAQISGTDYS